MKRKRRPVADKPGMRYARILAAIDKAEKEIRQANARLTALRTRQARYERRLGVDRVDEIKARRLTQTAGRLKAKTTKSDARWMLESAARLAFEIATPETRKRHALTGKVVMHRFYRGAGSIYAGWRARVPDGVLLWHPVRGYGRANDIDGSMGNVEWLGKHPE